MIPSYTKPTIRKGRLFKDGTTDVLIYYHRTNTEYFGTDVQIDPIYWDKKHRQVKDTIGDDYSKELNHKIQSVKKELDGIVYEFKKENNRLPTASELRLKRFCIQELDWSSNSYDFLHDFQKWITYKEKVKNSSKGTIDIYIQTLRYLNKFIEVERKYDIRRMEYKNYQFDSIHDVNLEFLQEFKNWLGNKTSRSTKMNLSNSTINKQIRNLTQFLRAKSKEGENINANVFNIELDRNYARRAFLTEGEIQKIKMLNLNNIEDEKLTPRGRKSLQIVKDIFIFNLFFGLRVSDLFDIANDDINLSSIPRENYLLFFGRKSKQETKLPILSSDSMEIIKKYITNNSVSTLFPKMSVTAYNNNLKRLAKYAGINTLKSHPVYSNGKVIKRRVEKWKLISSHSIRKTSINKNILELGRDISKYLSTHKSESGFQPYEEITDYDKIFDQINDKKSNFKIGD